MELVGGKGRREFPRRTIRSDSRCRPWADVHETRPISGTSNPGRDSLSASKSRLGKSFYASVDHRRSGFHRFAPGRHQGSPHFILDDLLDGWRGMYPLHHRERPPQPTVAELVNQCDVCFIWPPASCPLDRARSPRSGRSTKMSTGPEVGSAGQQEEEESPHRLDLGNHG